MITDEERASVSSVKRSRQALSGVRKVSCDDIVRFYETRPASRKPMFTGKLRADQWTLTSSSCGITDSVLVSDFSKASASIGCAGSTWINSEVFHVIAGFNPYHRGERRPFMVSFRDMVDSFNLGSGHVIQKIQRLFNLPINPSPCGVIVPANTSTAQTRSTVAVHFTPESLIGGTEVSVAGFMNNHCRSVDFIEIGPQQMFPGITRHTPMSSALDLIGFLVKCVAFVGIPCGAYHVAHALGVKTIIAINTPEPWEVMLPIIGGVDVHGADHLYPQSAILHQRSGSAHWPLISIATMEMAFSGRVFPYDSPDKYLELALLELP